MLIPIEQLRALCAGKNTNIKTMEKDLGMGNGVISRWYQRGTQPSYARLEQIADYLGVTVEYLTGKTEQPTVPDGLSEDDRVIRTLVS